MRTFILAVAAAATLAAGSLANRADAMTIGNPAGLRHAIEDTDLTDKVHCRWGRPHHRRSWGWWDGCYRGRSYYQPYYAPPVFYFGSGRWYGHRHHYRVHRHHLRRR